MPGLPGATELPAAPEPGIEPNPADALTAAATPAPPAADLLALPGTGLPVPPAPDAPHWPSATAPAARRRRGLIRSRTAASCQTHQIRWDACWTR